jgi:Superfamily I DNA and RNA helicases
MQLSEEQKSAVSHLYGPALVLAVPGSGKTTVLIHRIYNLINSKKLIQIKYFQLHLVRHQH